MILSYLILEGLIFHSGLYDRYLETSSSTGIFERTYLHEKKRKPQAPDEVLVVGDSRIGEGFSSKIASAACSDHGYYFANVAIAGTTPRSWYYLLRDLDPTRKRYRAIVLPVPSYDDIDDFEDLQDWRPDIHYCIMRLRYSDAYEFPLSFQQPRRRLEAIRVVLFKGIVLQSDLLAFFEHFHRRLANIEQFQANWWGSVNAYEGHSEDLAQLQVDWEKNTIRFPETLPPNVREKIRQDAFGPYAAQTGALGRYYKQWFGKILDLYRNSDTSVVFLALPRGPAVPPKSLIQPVSHVIRDMAQKPGVILLPENSFVSLERGDFYFDSMHLNARGRVQFSEMLAQLIRRTLGPSRN